MLEPQAAGAAWAPPGDGALPSTAADGGPGQAPPPSAAGPRSPSCAPVSRHRPARGLRLDRLPRERPDLAPELPLCDVDRRGEPRPAGHEGLSLIRPPPPDPLAEGVGPRATLPRGKTPEGLEERTEAPACVPGEGVGVPLRAPPHRPRPRRVKPRGHRALLPHVVALGGLLP